MAKADTSKEIKGRLSCFWQPSFFVPAAGSHLEELDMSDKTQPPLDWSATEDGPDVSIHLNAAQNIAGTLMAIDGHKNLDSLPEGAVCTLMIMLERELSAAERILENGHLRGGAS